MHHFIVMLCLVIVIGNVCCPYVLGRFDWWLSSCFLFVRSDWLIRLASLQVQTRSADEPMTIFVVCNECGNRWKVGISVSVDLCCLVTVATQLP